MHTAGVIPHTTPPSWQSLATTSQLQIRLENASEPADLIMMATQSVLTSVTQLRAGSITSKPDVTAGFPGMGIATCTGANNACSQLAPQYKQEDVLAA